MHSFHTDIFHADSVEEAFWVAREAVGENYGTPRPSAGSRSYMRGHGPLTTPNKGIRDANNEEEDRAIPVCAPEDVITDTFTLKFSLNAEQYSAFEKFNASYPRPNESLQFLKDNFGIDLPGKHAGRQDDAAHIDRSDDCWTFKSAITSSKPEGEVVKKFHVVKSSTMFRSHESRISHTDHDTQAQAAAEARNWLGSHPEAVNERLSVRSKNVRSEGSEDLVRFERVISKATAAITVTLERMKPFAQRAAWAVGVDYHC